MAKVTLELRKMFNLMRKLNSQIKKAIKPLANEKKKAVKKSCPIDDGELRRSIDFKLLAKGGKNAAIVVGPRSKYKETSEQGEEIIPNKYARVQDDSTKFISDNVSSNDVERLRELVRDSMKEIL